MPSDGNKFTLAFGSGELKMLVDLSFTKSYIFPK
jgi:hypothetical protein